MDQSAHTGVASGFLPWPTRRELTIGEVAERSGVAVSALRYYETKGLIKSRRTPGNHRVYPREVLRIISVIKVAQRTGLSLDEIQKYLAQLPDSGVPTKDDWTRMSTAWKAELEARIARLTRLKEQLDQCIGCGCLSLADCPLRNPDDQLGAEGPGPRLLDP
ncbi:MAG TPA: redox-sensitive transcriptional activator SoxR [Limnochordales bacterium]|nr:redox-sensitive transcriptional activator SoxR [Limnochordales bacterium]